MDDEQKRVTREDIDVAYEAILKSFADFRELFSDANSDENTIRRSYAVAFRTSSNFKIKLNSFLGVKGKFPLTSEEKDYVQALKDAIGKNFLEFKSRLQYKLEKLGLEDSKDLITIDKWQLENVTLAWFHDEQRHKDYHEYAIMQRHKQAAYFLYWIVKIKPIHRRKYSRTDYNDRDSLDLVNEMFGFYYALSMMGITPSNLSHDFLQEFIYLLRHRDFRPESLCTTLGLLEKAVKGIAI